MEIWFLFWVTYYLLFPVGSPLGEWVTFLHHPQLCYQGCLSLVGGWDGVEAASKGCFSCRWRTWIAAWLQPNEVGLWLDMLLTVIQHAMGGACNHY
jgi:hypothetical protein